MELNFDKWFIKQFGKRPVAFSQEKKFTKKLQLLLNEGAEYIAYDEAMRKWDALWDATFMAWQAKGKKHD